MESPKLIMLAPLSDETKEICDRLRENSVKLEEECCEIPQPFTMELRFVHLRKRVRKILDSQDRRHGIAQRRLMRKFQGKK